MSAGSGRQAPKVRCHQPRRGGPPSSSSSPASPPSPASGAAAGVVGRPLASGGLRSGRLGGDGRRRFGLDGLAAAAARLGLRRFGFSFGNRLGDRFRGGRGLGRFHGRELPRQPPAPRLRPHPCGAREDGGGRAAWPPPRERVRVARPSPTGLGGRLDGRRFAGRGFAFAVLVARSSEGWPSRPSPSPSLRRPPRRPRRRRRLRPRALPRCPGRARSRPLRPRGARRRAPPRLLPPAPRPHPRPRPPPRQDNPRRPRAPRRRRLDARTLQPAAGRAIRPPSGRLRSSSSISTSMKTP